MKVLTTLTLLGAITFANATTSDLMVSESRKNVRQSSSPSPLNSIASSQDGQAKQQSQLQNQQPSQQLYNIKQDYSNTGQPHSTVYNHIQSAAAPSSTPQNGYIISVNGQQAAGPTPVLMQYLPQNQQSGGIQYLQLIPTRPLIVPISPYITQLPQYNGQPTTQPTSAQYASASSTYGPAQPAYGAVQSTYAPTQSTYGTQSSPSSSHNYQSYQNPIGGYSSPVVSYFRPHAGIQLVDSPVDMSLNTNEYIPIQSENAYKMRRA
ncbi:DNA-directed RNA polymerase II subunit rpb1 [Bradysia coprophila]|uniref:DNA-directed RNA polymerase II subunit rpb1 n=1 Tax=Bradysia coprophila TaxID=38358 RepID=UPI00187DAD0E|nr:DNA-directed RNA polymerase II subunit rpb1 [Bradysia coprophila]